MEPMTMMMAASTVMGTAGALQGGAAAEAGGRYNAAMLEKEGKARFAKSTHEAAEAARQGRIAVSDVRAAQAGSGGTTTDPQAIQQQAGVKEEAKYNALAALFEGKSQQQGLQEQAKAKHWQGKATRKEAGFKALSTALSGGSKAYGVWKDKR